jgi:predicted ester cyclase
MGVASTGKRISMTGISIFKISEGKVAENRAVPDVLGMMRQIGVIPEPGQSEEASLT